MLSSGSCQVPVCDIWRISIELNDVQTLHKLNAELMINEPITLQINFKYPHI